MKIGAAGNGAVYIAYRSATAMVNRNMTLLVSRDHGQTFATSVVDPWKIGMCAMSTSALASCGPTMVGAWETQRHIRFFVASDDRPLKGPISVDFLPTNERLPSVAVNQKGEFIVVWTVGTGWNKGGSVAWKVFDKEAVEIKAQAGHADGLPVWSMPAAIARSDGTFAILY
jgi:hypothetical protein